MTTPIDQLASLAPRPEGVARRAAGASDRAAFDRLLDEAQAAHQGAAPDDARQTARKLVASTFIAPILRQMRESNHAPPPWGPTTAEKNFGPMLDAQIADQIVTGTDMPLVERITRDILRSAGGASNAADRPAAPTPSGFFNLRDNTHG